MLTRILSIGGLVLALSLSTTDSATARGLLKASRASAAAEAAEFESIVVERTTYVAYRVPQAMPQPIPDAGVAAAPGCATPVVAPCVCCPTPCIKYRHAAFDLGRLCRPKCCKPPVKLVLATKNPCTCCPVDVPVCLPGCCCGEPIVDCRKTLIGEGIVTYDWCCGVSVTIRYKKCGEVLVTYRGV